MLTALLDIQTSAPTNWVQLVTLILVAIIAIILIVPLVRH